MQLNLHPSRYFLMLILLVHIVAALLIISLPIKWWAIIVIEALLAASFVHMIQKHILRKTPKTIIAIWLDEKDWVLLTRAGDKLPAKLLRDTTSSSFLVTLNFRIANNKRQSVMIFPDSVDAASFKRLRRILKTWNF